VSFLHPAIGTESVTVQVRVNTDVVSVNVPGVRPRNGVPFKSSILTWAAMRPAGPAPMTATFAKAYTPAMASRAARPTVMPRTLSGLATSIHSSVECARPPLPPEPMVTAGTPRLIGMLLSVEDALRSGV